MNRSYTSNGWNKIAQITRRRAATLVPITLLSTLAFMLTVPISVLAGGILPPLGTAGSFGVLAGSAVTNTGPTTVRGNLGVSPGTAVSGFPPGIVLGTIYAGDSVAAQAQSDATIAYNNAAGQACDFDLTGQNLGGMTLTPGVYCFASSAQLTGQLTLDGLGNPDSVFIFQVGSTLTTASNATVLVTNGAQPCRVFWQVGSSATLGTDTDFAGNILALTSITLNTGASTSTGLYALNGAVTLDTNDIQACGFVQGATPTPTLASTETVTATSTAVAGTATATATTVLPTNTSTPVATNTPITTATTVASTATSTSEATNTPIPGATNTPIPVATNTPASTPTVVPNNTATAIASATGIAEPSATVISTPTAIGTGTPIITPSGTAVGTAIQTTTAIAIGTPTVTSASTPISTVVMPGETSVTTETTMTPTPQPLLPPTGGGQAWAAPFSLLLGVVLLLIGMNIRMLFRRVGIKVRRDEVQ